MIRSPRPAGGPGPALASVDGDNPMNRAAMLALLTLLSLPPVAAAQTDLVTIGRIRDEGFGNSKVMDHLFRLSDVIGPRLSGSPQLKRANEWSRDQLAAWGLKDAHLEPWTF